MRKILLLLVAFFLRKSCSQGGSCEVPGQVEGLSPAVCFLRMLHGSAISRAAGLGWGWPSPTLPQTTPACLHITNVSRVATVPKSHHQTKLCPRGAGGSSGPAPAASPAQCPLAGHPALDALRQCRLRGRHHRWLLHGTRWVWGTGEQWGGNGSSRRTLGFAGSWQDLSLGAVPIVRPWFMMLYLQVKPHHKPLQPHTSPGHALSPPPGPCSRRKQSESPGNLSRPLWRCHHSYLSAAGENHPALSTGSNSQEWNLDWFTQLMY